MKITKNAVLTLLKAKKSETTAFHAQDAIQGLYDQMNAMFDNELTKCLRCGKTIPMNAMFDNGFNQLKEKSPCVPKTREIKHG